MIWLILAYLFHTLGELYLSSVGLSYVSKLVPLRMIAFMFGMWYLAFAIGSKLATELGGQIENITKTYQFIYFLFNLYDCSYNCRIIGFCSKSYDEKINARSKIKTPKRVNNLSST